MKHIKPEATRPTPIDAIIKQTNDLSICEAQIIPNELMGFVIVYLKKDEQYKTLAAIAQCSQSLSELAIPKLYGTITVTKENQDMLVYGHSLASQNSCDDNDNQSKGKEHARKDFATTHTRKLILEIIPTAPIFECYPAVKEVVIKDVCHDQSEDPDDGWVNDRTTHISDSEYVAPPIYDTLAEYSLKHASSEPLHVDIQDSYSTAFNRLKLIANSEKRKAEAGETHDRITYGYHDLTKNCIERVKQMYMLRGAITSFWELEDHKRGSYAGYFGMIFEGCFRKDRIGMGRLYICGLPPYVLSPEEIEEAGDEVDEAALLKIYELWGTDPFGRMQKPKWEDYIARVHLVEPSYRRTMADVTEDHKQYLKDQKGGPIFWRELQSPICCRGLRPGDPMPQYWSEV